MFVISFTRPSSGLIFFFVKRGQHERKAWERGRPGNEARGTPAPSQSGDWAGLWLADSAVSEDCGPLRGHCLPAMTLEWMVWPRSLPP